MTRDEFQDLKIINFAYDRCFSEKFGDNNSMISAKHKNKKHILEFLKLQNKNRTDRKMKDDRQGG